jgi:hypothetical protein
VYYAVGYATAPTPIGPFTKYEGNPTFANPGVINGPGHGSVTRDRAGQLWHLYHQKTDTRKGWSRDICLDLVAFDDNGVFGGTPTRGVAQPAPNCDPMLVWSPDIHPRGAVFNDRVEVSLTSLTQGAEIRYTVDGTEPNESSPRYAGPFAVSETVTVRAQAYKEGMKASTVSRMRFTQTDKPLPANPAPNAAAGGPPFDVFPKPVLGWKKAE